MANDVDDIFKSFVTDKLKQFGMNGMPNAAETLEESLKKSALGSRPLHQSKESPTKPMDINDLAKKLKKLKKRKHKEEKKEKKRKRKKEKKEEKERDEKTAQDYEVKSLKKKLLLDEKEESKIKKKKLNSYNETVSKIKEIESLPLSEKKVEIMPQNNVENLTKESTVVNTENKMDVTPIAEVKNLSNGISRTPDTGTSNSDAVKTVFESDLKTEPATPEVAKLEKQPSIEQVASIPKTQSSDNNTTVPNEPTSTIPNGASNNPAKDTQKKLEVKKEVVGDKNEEKSSKKREHSRRRSRSRSRKHRKHSRSRSRSPRHRRHHHRHRHHRSRSRERHHRSSSSRHRKRERSPKISKEDKMKLLEIAKANVLAQHRAGTTLTSITNDSLAVMRSGGVTVEQLTGVCKDIQDGRREVSNEQTTNHPFHVKETPGITINLKSSTPTPSSTTNKPLAILSAEFPVSSGSQHQRKEVLEGVYGKWETIKKQEGEIAAPVPQVKDKVFDETQTANNVLMIKDVIAERVHAARALEENPRNENAIVNLQKAQMKLNEWTNSKVVPGQFTGSSSGLQPLSRSELEKGQQAWVNNHTLNSAKQVGGIGKTLLQKMGWKEGEPLGLTMSGVLEPIQVQVKTDRKGLTSVMEGRTAPPAMRPPIPKGNFTAVRDLSGKHPVSALMEICSKRKWPQPNFQCVANTGPDHQRSFLFKVEINGQEYQPQIPSVNKKLAKANAASIALQAMGMIPKVD